MDGEVGCRVAQHMYLGLLAVSVFAVSDLTLETKRMIYRSVVLGVLLHVWC